MEGGRPNGFNDFSGQSEFDSESYNQLNQINGEQSRPPRSKKEKINTIIIVVVGIAALIFCVYEMAYGIMNPFSFLNNSGSQNTATTTNANDSLKNMDTDGDGLSDYDETYIYNSSVYLEDTDGDGILDGQEVKNNTDPSCPQGQTCSTGYNFGASSSGTTPTLVSTPTISSANIDIATLRQMLVQGGMNKADVDELTDAEIMQMYQEVLSENSDLASQVSEVGISVSQASSTVSSTQSFTVPSTVDTSDLQIKSLDDMKNLSGAQIRALMIKNGASTDLLSQISDDDLKEMLLEKIKANSN
jgi:uncharacterized protein YxeA